MEGMAFAMVQCDSIDDSTTLLLVFCINVVIYFSMTYSRASQKLNLHKKVHKTYQKVAEL